MLAEHRDELAADTAGRRSQPRGARRRRTWDFADVNRLIEQHNRWYPVEAQLPMDPRTGDYALVGGRPYSRKPLDAAWMLERFPAPVQTL